MKDGENNSWTAGFQGIKNSGLNSGLNILKSFCLNSKKKGYGEYEEQESRNKYAI
jgi:hypothetical protein